jgi:SMC interacting uncharacterized protein involved in chromosome segregation
MDLERERARSVDEVRTQQGEMDAMSNKLNRLNGDIENKTLNYEERISHLTF